MGVRGVFEKGVFGVRFRCAEVFPGLSMEVGGWVYRVCGRCVGICVGVLWSVGVSAAAIRLVICT